MTPTPQFNILATGTHAQKHICHQVMVLVLISIELLLNQAHMDQLNSHLKLTFKLDIVHLTLVSLMKTILRKSQDVLSPLSIITLLPNSCGLLIMRLNQNGTSSMLTILDGPTPPKFLLQMNCNGTTPLDKLNI